MPIRGIIFIAVVALMIAVFKREEICSWLKIEFGEEENADDVEKENE